MDKMIVEENGMKAAFWFPNDAQISDIKEIMQWLSAAGFSDDAGVRPATEKDITQTCEVGNTGKKLLENA